MNKNLIGKKDFSVLINGNPVCNKNGKILDLSLSQTYLGSGKKLIWKNKKKQDFLGQYQIRING